MFRNWSNKYKRIHLGKVWIWGREARTYYSIILQMTAVSGILKILGLTWWGIVLLFFCMMITVILIVYLHMTYVFPQSLEYTFNKNPGMKIVMKELKDIKEKLNGK